MPGWNPGCLAICQGWFWFSPGHPGTKPRKGGLSLVTGHVPTHPFPVAIPGPNLTLTQTLDLNQGRVGTWPAMSKIGSSLVTGHIPTPITEAIPDPNLTLNPNSCGPQLSKVQKGHVFNLTLSPPGSKSTFSQPREICTVSDAVSISSIIIFHPNEAMKSQVLHTVWCYISGKDAGEVWNWSVLGVWNGKQNAL